MHLLLPSTHSTTVATVDPGAFSWDGRGTSSGQGDDIFTQKRKDAQSQGPPGGVMFKLSPRNEEELPGKPVEWTEQIGMKARELPEVSGRLGQFKELTQTGEWARV